MHMKSPIEAWVIHAESTGSAPRSTDDALFPWAWGEALAVLPGDATPAERAAALAVATQLTHLAGPDRSELTDFADRQSYLWGLAKDEYLSAFHPHLSISAARNVRYATPGPGEHRGRLEFEIVPASER